MFELLAPVAQFREPSRAAATVSESAAARLRPLSPATQSALSAHLKMLESQRPAPPSEDLWRLQRGNRALVCVAVYLPHGVDLRLLEGGDIVGRPCSVMVPVQTLDHRNGEKSSTMLAGAT